MTKICQKFNYNVLMNIEEKVPECTGSIAVGIVDVMGNHLECPTMPARY